MSRKIIGVIFILLAVIMTLAIVGQLPKLIAVWLQFIALFGGNTDAYQTGNVVGQLIYWFIHFAATFALWKYGVRWVGTSSKKPVVK